MDNEITWAYQDFNIGRHRQLYTGLVLRLPLLPCNNSMYDLLLWVSKVIHGIIAQKEGEPGDHATLYCIAIGYNYCTLYVYVLHRCRHRLYIIMLESQLAEGTHVYVCAVLAIII